MNPEVGFSMPEERTAAAKGGQLPLTVWIEQFQEWHGEPSGAADPVSDWERAWPPYPFATATSENLEDLGQQLAQLAKRIQVLEQRTNLSDPGSAPLG